MTTTMLRDMVTSVLLVICMSVFVQSIATSQGKAPCKPCKSRTCPKLAHCPHGRVLDQCGCCDVCLRYEGEVCGNLHNIRGQCQKGLFCFASGTKITHSTEGVCKPYSNPVSCPMFQCKASSQCLSWDSVCDGIKDCVDGEDEEKYWCLNKKTQTIQTVRNIVADGRASYPTRTCSSSEFYCQADSRCIDSKYCCDGSFDCSDGEDENQTLCPVPKPAKRTTTLPPDDKGACPDSMFKCSVDSSCLPQGSCCDGVNDCTDGEDEIQSWCPRNHPQIARCPQSMFTCSIDSRCLPYTSLCNGINDCIDGEDENQLLCLGNQNMFPQQCLPPMFRCSVDSRCIPQTSVCNGINDCMDGEDEFQTLCLQNQNNFPFLTQQCPQSMFRCSVDSRCLPQTSLCNGVNDCIDGEDEFQSWCLPNPPLVPSMRLNPMARLGSCPPSMFRCQSDSRCLPRASSCDGVNDCSDGEDEIQSWCPYKQKTRTEQRVRMTPIPPLDSCPSSMFKCQADSSCLPISSCCDGVYDCSDGADEFESACPPKAQRVTASPRIASCPESMFKCKVDLFCLPKALVCDGIEDCSDGEDEKNVWCPVDPVPEKPKNKTEACPDSMFRCKADSNCLSQESCCDGVNDCSDGEDETQSWCPPKPPGIPTRRLNDPRGRLGCPASMVRCTAASRCLPQSLCPLMPGAYPFMTNPMMQNLIMANPGMVNPGMVYPGMVNPGMVNPGMVDPGMVNPGMVNPGMVNPGMVNPGMVNDGMVNPGMALPPMVQYCEAGFLLCNISNTCINSTKWCDNKTDCPEGEDEKSCAGVPITPPTNSTASTPISTVSTTHKPIIYKPCPKGFHLCVTNKQCIANGKVCDGNRDCPQGEDEYYCGPGFPFNQG